MPNLRARDTISGSQAECYITIDGNRYFLMQAKNIEANIEKNKTQIGVLGKVMKGNKSGSAQGSGSATFYYNTSVLREKMVEYIKSGKDFYFDMQLSNEDQSSAAGRQTTILKDCNVDGLLMAMFDVDTEVLEEDFDFTFEDLDMPDKFNVLDGMQ
jgi:hypothetical protein